MHSALVTHPTYLICYFTLSLFAATSAFILTPESSKPIRHRPYQHLPGDPKTPSNPIVLVPGDGGARLEANLTGKPSKVHYVCGSVTADYFDLWLNLELFVPLVIDCWADNMRLVFNETTGYAENSPGVDIRVAGFSGTETVEYLDSSHRSPGIYFAPIVDALVSWGYKRGKNVVGAPFDWRRAPHELDDYYVMLKSMIEMQYRYNGRQKVVILAHSMGNPVMNYFYHNYVDSNWKSKYIQSHISLAGAWGGAMQIVKLFASGYNMDYYRVILPPSALRGMQRSFSSSAFLFPSTKLWDATEILAMTGEKNYTLSNLEEFFKDVGYTLGYKQYLAINPSLVAEAPGVEVHCIYGTRVQTPELFTWAKGYFPEYQPTIVYGDGDGTVNLRSLETCKGWNSDNNEGRNSYVNALPGAEHMGILSDQRTVTLLRNILYGQ